VNTTGGAQAILIQSGLAISLADTIDLNSADGDSLLGYGAVVDGSGLKGSTDCMFMDSPGGVVAGLAFRNCNRGIEVLSSNVTVANVEVYSSSLGLYVDSGLTGVEIGPNNFVHDTASYGLHLAGPAWVAGNRVFDTGGSGILILSGASGSVIFQNQIVRSGQFNVDIANQVSSLTVAHNVLHASAVHALGLGASSVATFDNNVVTNAVHWGIPVNPAGFSSLRGTLFWGSPDGACDCTLDGTNVELPPLYVNAAGDDYRPSLTSPLLENGILTGLDTNGPVGADNHFGAAPDIGVFEFSVF
jgi:hypothetical protein